jgi:hypothetical protein
VAAEHFAMPLFGLRGLVKSTLDRVFVSKNNPEPDHDGDTSDDCSFIRTPFGNAMPRRCNLEGNFAWQDKEPLQSGPYEYSCLKPDEIRLVYLYPGEPSDDINLGIETVNLDDVEEDYAALSYVWGDATITSTVYVNRHKFQATVNLVGALRHVRQMMREGEFCVLWIDAICINQANIEERNHQVRMMRRIYEQPALVII